jgi:hypothetical protein
MTPPAEDLADANTAEHTMIWLPGCFAEVAVCGLTAT